jgi:hypothetical protein
MSDVVMSADMFASIDEISEKMTAAISAGDNATALQLVAIMRDFKTRKNAGEMTTLEVRRQTARRLFLLALSDLQSEQSTILAGMSGRPASDARAYVANLFSYAPAASDVLSDVWPASDVLPARTILSAERKKIAEREREQREQSEREQREREQQSEQSSEQSSEREPASEPASERKQRANK